MASESTPYSRVSDDGASGGDDGDGDGATRGVGAAGSGHCLAHGCGCAAYQAQFYRPTLCLSCYHDISEHLPDWVRTQDAATRGTVFKNSVTGETLFARPQERRATLLAASASTASALGLGSSEGAAPGAAGSGTQLSPEMLARLERLQQRSAAKARDAAPADGTPAPSHGMARQHGASAAYASMGGTPMNPEDAAAAAASGAAIAVTPPAPPPGTGFASAPVGSGVVPPTLPPGLSPRSRIAHDHAVATGADPAAAVAAAAATDSVVSPTGSSAGAGVRPRPAALERVLSEDAGSRSHSSGASTGDASSPHSAARSPSGLLVTGSIQAGSPVPSLVSDVVAGDDGSGDDGDDDDLRGNRSLEPGSARRLSLASSASAVSVTRSVSGGHAAVSVDSQAVRQRARRKASFSKPAGATGPGTAAEIVSPIEATAARALPLNSSASSDSAGSSTGGAAALAGRSIDATRAAREVEPGYGLSPHTDGSSRGFDAAARSRGSDGVDDEGELGSLATLGVGVDMPFAAPFSTGSGEGGGAGASAAPGASASAVAASPAATAVPHSYSGAVVAPVDGDRLLVDPDLLSRSGGHADGSLVLQCQEICFDNLVTRHLFVTPTSLVMTEAHPTMLGRAIVKWERSLASLQSVWQQSAGVTAPAPKPRRRSMSLRRGSVETPASFSPLGSDGATSGSGEPQASLLLAFASETAQTLPTLLITRRGLAPVTREGPLKKKKLSSWKAVAWKERTFVLDPSYLTYYKAGGAHVARSQAPKGMFTLAANVDVRATDARAHAFAVQSPEARHMLAAASDVDRDLWMAAIATNVMFAQATAPSFTVTLKLQSMDALQRLRAAIHKFNPAVMGAGDEDERGFAGGGGMYDGFDEGATGGGGASGDGGDMADDDDLAAKAASGAMPSSPALSRRRSSSTLAAVPFPADPAHAAAHFGVDTGPSAVGPRASARPSLLHEPSVDAHRYWFYVDDSDRQQGPFSRDMMLGWLAAGYFEATTLVRNAAGSKALATALGSSAASGAGEGKGERYNRYLPISSLWPSGLLPYAFTDEGEPVWRESYATVQRYDTLVDTGVQLGFEVGKVLSAVYIMRENHFPPEMSILLDLLGATDPTDPLHEDPAAGPMTDRERSLAALGDDGFGHVAGGM